MASVKRDYYEVLSVERTADGEEIKRSYRRLAMKFHPDRNAGDADAEVKFKECAEAYEVLSDQQKRARYDQFGHSGVSGQHDFSHMQSSDIFTMFEEIFGGGGRQQRGGRAGPSRGYDLETQVELTLSEVASGAEKQIEFERNDLCDVCKGTGAKSPSDVVQCTTCRGQGQVAQQGFGGMFRMVVACPTCRGSGKTVKEACKACHGKGRQSKSRTITVKIPPGVHEGQAMRIAGEGEPGDMGGPPGDMHLYIGVKQHPIFTRHNNDLVCVVPVTFSQAALGSTLDVPTLKGTKQLEMPHGTQHGEVFKLKGDGLPDLRTKRNGDELVQIVIEVPRKLTEDQKRLLKEFAATEDAAALPSKKGFKEKIKDFLGGEKT